MGTLDTLDTKDTLSRTLFFHPAAGVDLKSMPSGQNWPNLEHALTFCLISGRKCFPRLWGYSFFGLIPDKRETRTNPPPLNPVLDSVTA